LQEGRGGGKIFMPRVKEYPAADEKEKSHNFKSEKREKKGGAKCMVNRKKVAPSGRKKKREREKNGPFIGRRGEETEKGK